LESEWYPSWPAACEFLTSCLQRDVVFPERLHLRIEAAILATIRNARDECNATRCRCSGRVFLYMHLTNFINPGNTPEEFWLKLFTRLDSRVLLSQTCRTASLRALTAM